MLDYLNKCKIIPYLVFYSCTRKSNDEHSHNKVASYEERKVNRNSTFDIEQVEEFCVANEMNKCLKPDYTE
jgi:hypothetical protein